MAELTTSQWIETSPYLKKVSEYTLFTTEKDLKQMRNGEVIEAGYDKIPIDFLKRILKNDFYYEYASRYFNDQTDRFCVSYIINGDTGLSLSYNRGNIIRGIQNLIHGNQIVLQPDEQQRFNNLKNSISFENFMKKHKGNSFRVDIDGIPYSIPIDQMISFLQSTDQDFNRICFDQDVQEIDGIPKIHFIYAIQQFFRESKAMSEYMLPVDVRSHFLTINILSNFDTEAINTHLTTTDTKYKEVQLDPLLEQTILSGMPEDVTDLEKALYIYIKMCKVLTYDDEYYAVNQRGIATQKHKNVNYVSFITPSNNKVTCFEFNLIYATLINKLGLHFCSNYKGFVGDDLYGEGHANLEFRSGKFLVNADSVTSILNGDMVQAKLNQPLVGITCINQNKQTKKEFNQYLSKMYQLVIDQENGLDKNRDEQTLTLDELLEAYSHTTTAVHDIDFQERFSILVDKSSSSKLVGIDFLSYTLQLRKMLFTEEQRKNNISVTIVRNNEPYDESKVAMASAIFTLNDQGFEDSPEQNQYFFFNDNHKPISLTKEELQARFDDRTLEYVAEDDPKIPGIREDGGMTR